MAVAPRDLFRDVKCYLSGDVPEQVADLLRAGGAELAKYFSDFVSHLICGPDAPETDLADAEDLYEIPAATHRWVLACVERRKIVSVKPYSPSRDRLFSGVVACLSRLPAEDAKLLYALLTYYGGRVKLALDAECTHLVSGAAAGAKYAAAIARPDSLAVVTPDWVADCVEAMTRRPPEPYHPRLLRRPSPEREPSPSPSPSSARRASAFDFDDGPAKAEGHVDGDAESTLALVDKLKQRMPRSRPRPEARAQTPPTAAPRPPQRFPPQQQRPLAPQGLGAIQIQQQRMLQSRQLRMQMQQLNQSLQQQSERQLQQSNRAATPRPQAPAQQQARAAAPQARHPVPPRPQQPLAQQLQAQQLQAQQPRGLAQPVHRQPQLAQVQAARQAHPLAGRISQQQLQGQPRPVSQQALSQPNAVAQVAGAPPQQVWRQQTAAVPVQQSRAQQLLLQQSPVAGSKPAQAVQLPPQGGHVAVQNGQLVQQNAQQSQAGRGTASPGGGQPVSTQAPAQQILSRPLGGSQATSQVHQIGSQAQAIQAGQPPQTSNAGAQTIQQQMQAQLLLQRSQPQIQQGQAQTMQQQLMHQQGQQQLVQQLGQQQLVQQQLGQQQLGQQQLVQQQLILQKTQGQQQLIQQQGQQQLIQQQGQQQLIQQQGQQQMIQQQQGQQQMIQQQGQQQMIQQQSQQQLIQQQGQQQLVQQQGQQQMIQQQGQQQLMQQQLMQQQNQQQLVQQQGQPQLIQQQGQPQLIQQQLVQQQGQPQTIQQQLAQQLAQQQPIQQQGQPQSIQQQLMQQKAQQHLIQQQLIQQGQLQPIQQQVQTQAIPQQGGQPQAIQQQGQPPSMQSQPIQQQLVQQQGQPQLVQQQGLQTAVHQGGQQIATQDGPQIATQQGGQQMIAWQQQQFLQQRQQQIVTGQPGTVGQRVSWGTGGRQLIHLDAQTHAQLQQMDPQQRALFVAQLQKRRQLSAQRAAQQQMQHPASHTLTLVRGQLPPGLTPQQQLQWVQQQGIRAAAAGASDSSSVAQQQTQQQVQQIQVQQPQQMQQHQQQQQQQYAQLQMRQQQHQRLQRFQAQVREHAAYKQVQPPALQTGPAQQPNVPQGAVAARQAIGPAIPDVTAPPTDATIVQQGLSPDQVSAVIQGPGAPPLVVNSRTKTALANMLSIRLQSTQPPHPQDVAEPSAAGTLRLMTAAHNAPPRAPTEVVQTLQQRRTLSTQQGPLHHQLPVSPHTHQQTLAKPTYGIGAAPGVVRTAGRTPAPAPPPSAALPRAQFYGHNPNLKLPPDLFLLGCIFHIVEYGSDSSSNVKQWTEAVGRHGGEVELGYCARVTHVLAQTQKHGVVMQALRDAKRCITAYWLSDTMTRRLVLPPWQALHLPLMYAQYDRPAQRHRASITGFTGEDRNRVRFMLEHTGAKITSYLSRDNTVLICKRPEGVKYQRARDWNIPTVSVQWVTDLLLGNMSALTQLEHSKYQQFTVNDPFRMDHTLVPHLMNPWKMPINISQESHERVKRGALPTTISHRPKKPRITPPTPIHNIPIVCTEKPDPMNAPRVLFSSIKNVETYSNIIRQLGGFIVTQPSEATHLVMGRLVRTPNFILALVTVKHILTTGWIFESQKMSKFAEETKFPLRDESFDAMFNCDISKILSTPIEERTKLFDGITFYMTPGVQPGRTVLSSMIEMCGGKVDKNRKSYVSIQEMHKERPYSYLVLTASNDLHLVYYLLQAEKNLNIVCNTELVLMSIMHQKVEVLEHLVKIN